MKISLVILSLAFCGLLGCATTGHQSRGIAQSDEDTFPEIDYSKLKKVDVLGIPFGDTVLNEQRTDRNIGANNLYLQDDFVLRFAHLAEHFSPDLEKLGMEPCYKTHTPGLKDDYREYQSGDRLINLTSSVRVATDFWNARRCFLQRVRFDSTVKWKPDRAVNRNIEMPRVINLFLPNVLTVDLDTTGTWPFGHRPNDQIGGRFTSLFLKMGSQPGNCRGTPSGFTPKTSQPLSEDSAQCHMESLNQEIDSPYHHWKTPNSSAFPFHPPKHVYIDEHGNKIVGMAEDEFPFLLPPNPGKGYYQTKPDAGVN